MGENNTSVLSSIVYTDKEKYLYIHNTLKAKNEELVVHRVYFVPGGTFVNEEAIKYKLNMFQM